MGALAATGATSRRSPPRLLRHRLEADDVLDLLAYLISGGEAKHRVISGRPAERSDRCPACGAGGVSLRNESGPTAFAVGPRN